MADNPICIVAGCDKPVLIKSRGFCNAHNRRFMRHGDPLAGGLPKGEAARFLNEVVLRHAGDDCLIWPYGKTTAGYGAIMLKNRLTHVHVHVCTVAHGPKPIGRIEAAHSCGNPSCCAPQHLRWATPRENALDKRGHGTMPRGERHHWARLSDAQAAAILASKGKESAVAVAARYGVNRSYVSSIWAGRLRSHVQPSAK